ncbi:MAG: cob(I)yrinic acid a,c-diamide adenosyltransferase [Patescibacteria group bacterium]
MEIESKIYTRTGDSGTTGLYKGPSTRNATQSVVGGGQVSKSSLRVATYGMVDELNATVSAAKAFSNHEDIKKLLGRIQHKLMNIASILASEQSNPPKETLPILSELDVIGLERCIDYFTHELPPISNFIIAGLNQAGAMLDVARTVCRRTERQIVLLSDTESVPPVIQKFLNRLSDLLFVLERYEHHQSGFGDVMWEK